jgi:hypothetical protein
MDFYTSIHDGGEHSMKRERCQPDPLAEAYLPGARESLARFLTNSSNILPLACFDCGPLLLTYTTACWKTPMSNRQSKVLYCYPLYEILLEKIASCE